MSSVRVSNKKISVLVVDESLGMRTLLNRALSSTPSIKVIGNASTAHIAREMLVRFKPDVMLLNLDIPGFDGVVFLEKVMCHYPTPTIVFGDTAGGISLSGQRALALGAIEMIPRGTLDPGKSPSVLGEELSRRIKAAADHPGMTSTTSSPLTSSFSKSQARPDNSETVLCIAASTGGPDAIKSILKQLPAHIPPTLVVQHMAAHFTRSFADHLNQLCAFPVREAVDSEPLVPGVALVAPGNFHMTLLRIAGRVRVRLSQGPAQHGVRPAADPFFESVAEVIGSSAIGVILTGMGRDGASGLLKLRQAGGYTIAQDAASSVVFGMPGAAIEQGAAQKVSPLDKIPGLIIYELSRRTVAKVV